MYEPDKKSSPIPFFFSFVYFQFSFELDARLISLLSNVLFTLETDAKSP